VQELCACATAHWPAAPKRGDYRSDKDGCHLPALKSGMRHQTVSSADERNHARLRRRQNKSLVASFRGEDIIASSVLLLPAKRLRPRCTN
jgi:hypothetical protein